MYRRNELIPLKTENTILKLNENSNSENEPIDRKLNKNRKKRKEKIAKIWLLSDYIRVESEHKQLFQNTHFR